MCIVLFTTAHPDYALIVIDNRDEFILRPTSKPHWWTHPTSGDDVLSSRDLQRDEKGTWFGITRKGLLAVLTNYREPTANGAPPSKVHGVKSRGGMVTAWLGGLPDAGVRNGVRDLVGDGQGVKGVGGFSMVCSKLRKKSEGIAIVSNRVDGADEVPLVGLERGEVWGLSNTVFNVDAAASWPKVDSGKQMLKQAVDQAVSSKTSEEELVASLFSILDSDTLPTDRDGMDLQEIIMLLKNTIFVPPVGDEKHHKAMQEAASRRKSQLKEEDQVAAELAAEQAAESSRKEESAMGFESGLYGTQRQTVMLVDWDGNVTFIERALWDEDGNSMARGEADSTVRFRIDGWDEE